uniref:transcobalamin-1-like n=1 Tax=Semicossyphus pulcher TaxID=241346 RepID=UPI0037E73F92
MMTPVLLSATLLLLLLPGAPATNSNQTPIKILVANSLANAPNQTYSTSLAFRGILLGGMRRLQDSNQGFSFYYTEDPNYGPFLVCVNGQCGCTAGRTYWELLVIKENNELIRPDVGIGCYIPCANETIILNYNSY